MSLDDVIFGVDGKRFPARFDRSHLRLGAIVYVQFSASGKPVAFSPQKFEGALKYAVNWIATSEWYVPLSRGFELKPWFADRVYAEIQEHISRRDVGIALEGFAKRVRLEHFHKTSELSENPLSLIYTVLERLDLCARVRQRECEKALFAAHEPLVSYLYLTCFDRLGQPADWLDFGSWLTSPRHLSERELALSKHPPQTGDPVEGAQALHRYYMDTYGVRASFFRFLHEVLPSGARSELLQSIEYLKLKNPPDFERLSSGTDAEKEKYLFKRRNDYTHRADFNAPAGEPLGRSRSNYVQEHYADYWTTTHTSDWPEILNKTVRVGLAQYLLGAIKHN